MTTTFSGEAYDGDETFASPFAGWPAASTEQPTPYSPADEPCRCRQETPDRTLAEPNRFPLAHESPEQTNPDAGELWVPGAERVANSRSAGGSYVPAPWRFVFHTIEGEPSADGFRRLAAGHVNSPHLWAMPSANLLMQTIPLNRAAYALARPGSVQTNRLHAVQVEVWGFAAKMGRLDQHAIEWLAERVLAPVARLVPINLDRVHPTGGVSCYGRNSHCRMAVGHWQSFDGVCGHQHVPDNEHWDPGEMPLGAIAARARQLVAGGAQREQLSDHDGPAFAAETDDNEFWTGNVDQLNPVPASPASAYQPPLPPNPPLTGPVPVTRNCCLLDPKSLKDMTTMGHYSTYGGVDSGNPGTVYTSKAGFVDLGHLFAVADVTAYVYQQIYAAKGSAGTTVTTAHGTATLSLAVPNVDWLEQARKIAYDDSIAYEIETTKGVSSYVPGHLNSAFSPEDLCSNYLGTEVAARALATSAAMSFGSRVDTEVRTLLVSLGAQSSAEAGKAFTLKNNIWVAWTSEASAIRPSYLKRRNFTNSPWLTGHPSDQPGAWAPTPFRSTVPYTYRHSSGFTNADFGNEIAAFRTWAQATFGANYDKP